MSQKTPNEELEESIQEILISIVGILFAFPLIIWNGFVAMKLWNWFIVKLGAMPIELWLAVGISLVISYLTYKVNYYAIDVPNKKRVGYAIASGIITPATFLLLGWIVKLIMG